MALKTIKNVDNDTWQEFKMLSVKNNLPMGKLLGRMIRVYEDNTSVLWREILDGEKRMSDKEAEEMQQYVKNLRKEYGFRR